jgi:hypothetical protein
MRLNHRLSYKKSDHPQPEAWFEKDIKEAKEKNHGIRHGSL